MNKYKLILLIIPVLLCSCSGIGAKKNKNIVELTPKLLLESNEAILLESSGKPVIFDPKMFKNQEFSIASKKIIAKPVFNKGVIYVVDANGTVSAFSTKNKKILWSRNISSNQSNNSYLGGGILCHDGKVYVTYGSRFLVILNSDSGNEIIRKELPDIIRTNPVLINNRMIAIQTVSNQVFAIDINNLNIVWQHESLAETLSSSYHVAPIVVGEKVIVNYNSGQIFSLNANNGEVLWNNNLSNPLDIGIPNYDNASVLCEPIVNYPYLYLAHSAGKIVKFDLNNGNVIWQIKAEDIQSMSLAGNSLLVTNNALQFVVISTNSGKVKFAADLKEEQGSKKIKANSFLPPIVSNADNEGLAVYIISSRGQLYSFKVEKNGKLAGSPAITPIPAKIVYSGVTCCNKVYFTTERKIILAESKK